jgi:pimeloyl-ACP methyl ester carboxylesterase
MQTFCINLETSPIGKIPIFLKKWGGGPKILLVHGWRDTSQKWSDLAGDLMSHYEVWTPDLPAFGETPAIPLHHTTLGNYAKILATLINHLAPGEGLHAIVGHSMGGLLSLLLLKNRPHLSRHLVVCGAPVVGVRYLKPLTDYENLVKQCFLAIQPLPLMGKLLKDVIDVNAAASLLKQVCACDLLKEAKPSAVNVLVLRGKHDPFLPRTAATRLAGKLGGVFYEFQGAFHAPMTEQPTHFRRVIRSFLDKV